MGTRITSIAGALPHSFVSAPAGGRFVPQAPETVGAAFLRPEQPLASPGREEEEGSGRSPRGGGAGLQHSGGCRRRLAGKMYAARARLEPGRVRGSGLEHPPGLRGSGTSSSSACGRNRQVKLSPPRPVQRPRKEELPLLRFREGRRAPLEPSAAGRTDRLVARGGGQEEEGIDRAWLSSSGFTRGQRVTPMMCVKIMFVVFFKIAIFTLKVLVFWP